METVNERIKYLRKDVLRLTQEKFAADLHITRSSLSVIEIGKTVTDRNIDVYKRQCLHYPFVYPC